MVEFEYTLNTSLSLILYEQSFCFENWLNCLGETFKFLTSTFSCIMLSATLSLFSIANCFSSFYLLIYVNSLHHLTYQIVLNPWVSPVQRTKLLLAYLFRWFTFQITNHRFGLTSIFYCDFHKHLKNYI